VAGWLKMRKDLDEDVRVHRIALVLKLSVDAVLGKLFRLWKWADTHAGGEDVDGLTLAWINAKVEQSGFAEQLVAAGWIAPTPTGFRLVNFAEHNWQAAKDKALAADRQASQRKKESRKSHAQGVTGTVTGPSQNRDLPIPIPLPPPYPPPSEGEFAETARPSAATEPPALLTFECDGPVKEWHLAQATVDSLRAAYPSLDVLGEARKALAWVQADPGRKKTARGMLRFLTGWMGRAQDHGRGRGVPAAAPPPPAGPRPPARPEYERPPPEKIREALAAMQDGPAAKEAT
jgi:hypothetical protein